MDGQPDDVVGPRLSRRFGRPVGRAVVHDERLDRRRSPGALVGSSARAAAICASSSHAGIWMISFTRGKRSRGGGKLRAPCDPPPLAAFFLPLSLLAQDAPPKESGPFRKPDLVELVTLDPTIRLDVRYASAKNEFGRPFYPEARVFLQRPGRRGARPREPRR